jgi:uncharacterized LabA/DUF88 family protein
MLFGKDKVVVYIDGGNTYRKLKELGLPQKDKRFNYSAFVNHLVGERNLVSKRYYVGIVKNHDNSKKGEDMVKSQQKFLSGLENEGFVIKRGRIMYDGKRIREKGVDVKLSIDLVIGAVDHLYDTAIVVSSDTDLIPAIQYVRNGKNKQVEYIGFTHSPSLGLVAQTKPRLLAESDLMPFQVDKV